MVQETPNVKSSKLLDFVKIKWLLQGQCQKKCEFFYLTHLLTLSLGKFAQLEFGKFVNLAQFCSQGCMIGDFCLLLTWKENIILPMLLYSWF